MLSKEEQRRATAVCITLVTALKQWAPSYVSPPKSSFSLSTGPGPHARAILQLLARLTKTHTLAQQACSPAPHLHSNPESARFHTDEVFATARPQCFAEEVQIAATLACTARKIAQRLRVRHKAHKHTIEASHRLRHRQHCCLRDNTHKSLVYARLHSLQQNSKRFTLAILFLVASVPEVLPLPQALDAKVHLTILDLPGCAFRPEHAAHICAIMRHLLEDPATLQAAMEAEIRSALNQKTSRSGGIKQPFDVKLCADDASHCDLQILMNDLPLHPQKCWWTSSGSPSCCLQHPGSVAYFNPPCTLKI